jgi:diguanylate cyclase (GGDEF)-like protein
MKVECALETATLPVEIMPEMLDVLLPLHVLVVNPGRIIHVGPTFAKLLNAGSPVGQDIFKLLEFRRPVGLRRWEGLNKATGLGLVARLEGLSDHNLKAVCVPLVGENKILINFSLGAGIHKIVASRNLKIRDFSPADSTGEMLYMKEIQSVVLSASRDLNNRLDGAKTMAEEQAYTDSLTGLNNRRALHGFIARLQDRNALGGFAVMQIDLDFFKSVNDTYGHAAGDHVLQEVSRVLLSETRSTDLVARVGGDEFVVVLSDFGTADHLREVGHRIIEKVAKPISYGPHKCQIGASIGAAIVEQGNEMTVDELLALADRALYRSKNMGRGMFSLA